MVEDSTKTIIKKKNKRSTLRTLLVLLIILLLLSSIILFFILFNPNRQVIASPLNMPQDVKITETDTGDRNNKNYKLTFSPVINADYYTLYIFKGKEEAQQALDNRFENIIPTFTFGGTEKDVTSYMTDIGDYYFSVQAVCRRVPSYSSDKSNPFDCKHDVLYYLSTPDVEVTEVGRNNFEVAWESVANATGYQLDIVDAVDSVSILNNVVEVTGNYYKISDEILEIMNSKTYTDFIIKVRAISTNEYVVDSDWGFEEAHTHKIMKSPVLSYSYVNTETSEQHLLTWNDVTYANIYDIYLDGVCVESINAPLSSLDITKYITHVGEFNTYVEAKSISQYVDNVAKSNTVTFDVYGTTPMVSTLELERSGNDISVRWVGDDSNYEKYYILHVQNEKGEPIVSDGENSYLTIKGDENSAFIPIDSNQNGCYKVALQVVRTNKYFYPSNFKHAEFKFTTTKLSAPIITQFNDKTKELFWSAQPQPNEFGMPYASDNNGFLIKIWTQSESGEKTKSITIPYVEGAVPDTYIHQEEIKAFFEGGEAGNYYISVQALGGRLIWQTSDESKPWIYKHIVSLKTPNNVEIKTSGSLSDVDPTLVFDEVENAISYRVSINDTDVGILISKGEEGFNDISGYNITEADGKIYVKGWNTYFNKEGDEKVSGNYIFKVQAIASDDNQSFYSNSEWSSGATYQLVRGLAVPEIIGYEQNTDKEENSLIIKWKRFIDGTEEKIYDEELQTFDIDINGTVRNIDALTATMISKDHYALEISDYLIPGTNNYVKITACKYKAFDEATASINVEYYYFLKNVAETFMQPKIKGNITTNDDIYYSLKFNTIKYANLYKFNFKDITSDDNPLTFNYYDLNSTEHTFNEVNDAWIVPFGKTRVEVIVSYDENQPLKDDKAMADYIKETTFDFESEDDVKLPGLKDLAYDETTSTFTWRFMENAASGLSHFGYAYYFTELAESGKNGKMNAEIVKTEVDETDGVSYNYYQAKLYFERAGQVKFTLTPISSASDSRKNGESTTIDCYVYAVLPMPTKVLIIKDENSNVLITWDAVEGVQTYNAYTVELYENDIEEKSLIGSAQVNKEEGTVSINITKLGAKLNDKKTYIARVRANEHTPIPDSTGQTIGYVYAASEWGVSPRYEYIPDIAKPFIEIDGSDLYITSVKNASNYNIYYRVENNRNSTRHKIDASKIIYGGIIDGNHKYDLSSYFNNLNIVTGTYYISVTAENTTWGKESEESVLLEYQFKERFDSPSTVLITAKSSYMDIRWSKVRGQTVKEENGELTPCFVEPSGYEFVVGPYSRSNARSLFVQVLIDANGYKLGIKTDIAINFENQTGTTTDSKTYTFYYASLNVYATLTVEDSGYQLVISYGGLKVNSKYWLDVTTLGNTQYNFDNSYAKSVEFVCYSDYITTPVLYFDPTSKARSVSADSDTQALYISNEKFSQNFNVSIINKMDSQANEILLENQSAPLVVTQESSYRRFDLDLSLLESFGIYEVKVRYTKNDITGFGKSEYSLPAFIYKAQKFDPLLSMTVTGQGSGTQPAKVVLSLPTSQTQVAGFNTFELVVKSLKDNSKTTIRLLEETFSCDKQNANGITTYTYSLPIGELKMFFTNGFWEKLDYNLEFSAYLVGSQSESNLIATYNLPTDMDAGCFDEFVFRTNSNPISTILFTSEQTPVPTNVYLQDNKVAWSSVSADNVTYKYMYYKWNLLNNTYTFFYDSSKMEPKTIEGDEVLVDGEKIAAIAADDPRWVETTNSYFEIWGFEDDDDVVYGVILFAEAGIAPSERIHVTLSKNAKYPNFTSEDIMIDEVSNEYFIAWNDVFKSYSTEIFTDAQKMLNYSVFLDGEKIELTQQNTSYNTSLKKIVLNIGSVLTGGQHVITITSNEFIVTTKQVKQQHKILLPKTIETSMSTPSNITSAVHDVKVIKSASSYIASWSHVENATIYKLIITNDHAKITEMNDLNGNFSGENIINFYNVSVRDLNVSDIKLEITPWISEFGIGKYQLWVCVEDDQANNVVGYKKFETDSRASFELFDNCSPVKNLTYTYDKEQPARWIKYLTWDDLALAKSDSSLASTKANYKLEIFSENGTKMQLGTTGVYELLFSNVSGDASVIGGEKIKVDNDAHKVSIDITDYLNNTDLIPAGNYKIGITVLPSDSSIGLTASAATYVYIQNVQSLDDDIETSGLIQVFVDSFIESVKNGEPEYISSSTSVVNSYLSKNLFNTKSVKFKDDFALPNGARGVGIVVYKQNTDKSFEQLAIKEFYSISGELGLSLGTGSYKFAYYFIGDETLGFSDSEPKFDEESIITIYQRHRILTNLNASYIKSDGKLAGIRIPHGIDLAGSKFVVYCFQKGDTIPVWVSAEKTTVAGDPFIDIYDEFMKNSSKMDIGDYVFKVKWLATQEEIENKILNSDLNETKGFEFTNTIEIEVPTSTSSDVEVEKDAEGYVTKVKAKVKLSDPQMGCILHYQFAMWDSTKSNMKLYNAYVEVSYMVKDLIATPTYNILTSGQLISDNGFSISGSNLVFDMLSYIEDETRSGNVIVGNYYYDVGVIDALRGEKVVKEVNQWVNGQKAITLYTHKDIYGTRNDKIQKADGGQLYLDVKSITLSTSGVLSWSFTDSTYAQADHFEVGVNGNKTNVSYSSSKLNYSINIKEMIWADDLKTGNPNNIYIKLVIKNDGKSSQNWISPSKIFVVSSTNNSVYSSNPDILKNGVCFGYNFTWSTSLDVGGTINNEDWDSSEHIISFDYLFNPYYAQDSRINGTHSSIKFKVDLLYNSNNFLNKSFASASSMSGTESLSLTQAQLESLSGSSGRYNMTFKMGKKANGSLYSYAFNLKDVLNKYKSSWIEGGEVKGGYIYVRISLVNGEPYDDGVIYTNAKYIAPPWVISNVSVIDGHSSQTQKTLILSSQVSSSSSQKKQNWADKQKIVYIEFDVSLINGQSPEGYSLIAYYKPTDSSEEYQFRINNLVTKSNSGNIISVERNGDKGTITLNISHLFNSGGMLKNLSGLISFRVIGHAIDGMAGASTLSSSEKISYNNAVANFVRLNDVASLECNAVSEESRVQLSWKWNFPEYHYASYEYGREVINLKPTLEIINYKSSNYSGEPYGSDKFFIIGYNYDYIKTYLSDDSGSNQIKGTAGDYNYYFGAGNNLALQRSLSENNPIYNYLTYQVKTSSGSNFKYLLDSEVVTQRVFYVKGYSAPGEFEIKNIIENNEVKYVEEDKTPSLSDCYHQMTFSMSTESFEVGSNDIAYSYFQFKTYEGSRLLNGKNGVILKIGYKASSNASNVKVYSIQEYDPSTGRLNHVLDFDGTVDLRYNFNVSITLNKVPLSWLFGDLAHAQKVASYKVLYNVYVPEMASGQGNDVKEEIIKNNIKYKTPTLEKVEVSGYDISRTSDGKNYIKYTGSDANFKINISLSNVSDHAKYFYFTITSQNTPTTNLSNTTRFVIDASESGVRKTGSGKYTIELSSTSLTTYFNEVLSLLPNKLGFYIQIVNKDLNDGYGYFEYDDYANGIFKSLIVGGPAYVDSYRSARKEIILYKELANPSAEFFFEIDELTELKGEDDCYMFGEQYSNLIVIGTNEAQISSPYLYINETAFKQKNQNYSNQDEYTMLGQKVDFRIEIIYGSKTISRTYSSDRLYIYGRASGNAGNVNLYSDIASLVSGDQGGVVQFKIWTESTGTSTNGYYWIDAQTSNRANASTSKTLRFYQNVKATNAKINENALTYENTETTFASTGKRTGLLKPKSIPLSWDYDKMGTSQSSPSGYRVMIIGISSSGVMSVGNYNNNISGSTTNINLVPSLSSGWNNKNFNFSNWEALKNWQIYVQPYYNVDRLKVYGMASYVNESNGGNYILKFKLSGLRDITTNYSFNPNFQKGDGVYDVDSSSGRMAKVEPNWNNSGNPAVFTSITGNGFGNYKSNNAENVSSNYISGFTIKIDENSRYTHTQSGEFSPETFIKAINSLMREKGLIGGTYSIQYKLNGLQSLSFDSDWSKVYTLTYRAVLNGNGVKMQQEDDDDRYITVYYTDRTSNYDMEYDYYVYQNGQHYSVGGDSGEITEGLIDKFSFDKLDALTAESSMSVSDARKCVAGGYVYTSSNLGYLQLGINELSVEARVSDDYDGEYTVGFKLSDSVEFNMPSIKPKFGDAKVDGTETMGDTAKFYFGTNTTNSFNINLKTGAITGSEYKYETASNNGSEEASLSFAPRGYGGAGIIRYSTKKIINSVVVETPTFYNYKFKYSIDSSLNKNQNVTTEKSSDNKNDVFTWKNTQADKNITSVKFTLKYTSQFSSNVFSQFANYGLKQEYTKDDYNAQTDESEANWKTYNSTDYPTVNAKVRWDSTNDSGNTLTGNGYVHAWGTLSWEVSSCVKAYIEYKASCTIGVVKDGDVFYRKFIDKTTSGSKYVDANVTDTSMGFEVKEGSDAGIRFSSRFTYQKTEIKVTIIITKATAQYYYKDFLASIVGGAGKINIY